MQSDLRMNRDVTMNMGSRLFRLAVLPSLALTAILPGIAGAQETSAKKDHPLKKAIELTEQSLEKMRKIDSYTAQLTKKEIVGKLAVTHKMDVKIRHEPFSVYLCYVDPSKGREVLFIEGQNNGNLLAHDVGMKAIFGSVSLNPTGQMAMEGNRYPITKIGLVRSVEEVVAQWKKELKYGGTQVKYYPNAKLDKKIACRVIESTHPKPFKQFKFKTTRLWFDAKTNLPIRIEQFGFPKNPKDKAPLVEQYTYRNLKANLKLTDRDFDKKNPKYNF